MARGIFRTRDQTHVPYLGFWTTGPPGKSLMNRVYIFKSLVMEDWWTQSFGSLRESSFLPPSAHHADTFSLYCSHGDRWQERQESWKEVDSNPTVSLGPCPSQLGLWRQNMVGQVASRADVYFSCFWRLEAQVRVLADSVLGEGPLPGLKLAIFSNLRMAEGGIISPKSLIQRACIHSVPPLGPDYPPYMGDKASPYELGRGVGRHSFHSSSSLIFYEPCFFFVVGSVLIMG